MTRRYVRVVTLWVHPGQEAAFEAFEREAARLMAGYGGRIDHAVRLNPSSQGEEAGAYELHVVSFPDRKAFDAYGADSAVVALRKGRDRIIARTETLEDRETDPY
ncbi:MAG: hypothetical protein GC155_13940 [Alphaproteobacteria bacterium]|nr:hypothetical protein [Alphaproteobacteria bacterium]